MILGFSHIFNVHFVKCVIKYCFVRSLLFFFWHFNTFYDNFKGKRCNYQEQIVGANPESQSCDLLLMRRKLKQWATRKTNFLFLRCIFCLHTRHSTLSFNACQTSVLLLCPLVRRLSLILQLHTKEMLAFYIKSPLF